MALLFDPSEQKRHALADFDPVHVITSASVRRAGIRVHRNVLAANEVTELDGVPITTASRVIIDLAPRSDIENLLAQAYAKHLTTRSKILTLVARYPRHPGVPALRRVLDAGPQLTRSPLSRPALQLR